MIHLNWIDYLIVLLVFFSMIKGLSRGFIKELVSLVVWSLGIWFGLNYFNDLANLFLPFFHDQAIRYVASLFSIIIFVLIIGSLSNHILIFLLNHSGLSGSDRFFGMFFGILRGFFMVSIFILACKMSSFDKASAVQFSYLWPHFNPLVSFLDSCLPNFIKEIKKIENPA